MNSARYVRRVSPLERYSLVLHQAYRYQVDAIVEGVGEIDVQDLQRAVEVAAAANPAIRVRLRGILGWSKWVDTGRAPIVKALPLSDWDGNSEAFAPYLKERLQPRQAVADVLLVPCRDGFTRLVFRTMHAAIDGRGCMHWIAEVFRVLRGEEPLGSDSSLLDLEVKEQYAEKIPEEPEPPPANCIPVVKATPADNEPLQYIWRRVLIDRDVPQLLTKTAAFLADWARKREPGDVGFTVPVDFRGFRTEEMGIGNLTGYLRLTVPEDASPRSLMVQLAKRIKAYADCRQMPGERILFWLPVWFMLRQLRPKVHELLYTVTPVLPTGGVVSMGSLKAEQFDAPGFKAERAYGIPGAVGKFNLIFVNYPDHVCVSVSAPAAYNHDGQFDELVTAYQAYFSAGTAS